MTNNIILFNPPLYFSNGKPKSIDVTVPPLGLLYLATYLNFHYPQFRPRVIDISVENISLIEIEKLIKKEKPMVVGITSMTPQLQGAVELASVIKKISKTKIILGGPHISADPDFIKRFKDIFDYGITGEAEITFAITILKLSKSILPPKIQIGQIPDLSLLQIPDKSLIKREKYQERESIMFSRGCPYNCYYCSRPAINRLVRYRTVKSVIEEILKMQYWCHGRIDFQDDTLTLRRDIVENFCYEIITRGLKINWRCNTRIDLVDEKLLTLMGKAGCSLIHFGIEAGSQKIRETIVNKGRFSNEKIIKTINWCHRNNIKFAGYFMIGHPGEKNTDLEKTKKMVLKSGIDLVGLSIPTPFPGSLLYDMAKMEGVINNNVIDKFAKKELGEGYAGNYPLYTSKKISRGELFKLMKDLNRKFYLKPAVFWSKLKEDGLSLLKLKKDIKDLLWLILKGVSSRKPYIEK